MRALGLSALRLCARPLRASTPFVARLLIGLSLSSGAALSSGAVLSSGALMEGTARADEPIPPRQKVVGALERTLIRYYAPETGGPQKPRFISERTLGFFARLEAMSEKNPNVYEERFVRSASERFVAEDMLAELMIRAGTEPDNLPRLVADARTDLCNRLGNCLALTDAMALEGIDENELAGHLRRKIRAAYYIDRAIAPILHPAEDELFESYRTAVHPFRGMKYDDCRAQLSKWLTFEKLRVAELEFLQSARARVRIVSLFVKTEG